MEMYADSTSRGGVLEAEAIVSIKLRLKDQKPIMERLDPVMKSLMAQLKVAPTAPAKNQIETEIKKRVEVLSPIYHQVAVTFADLHDTPERMLAKGVIRDVIEWRESRPKLYWRLKRRLHEKKMMAKIESTGASLNQGQKTELLRRWFADCQQDKYTWQDDKAVAEWLAKQIQGTNELIEDNLQMMKKETVMSQMRSLLGQLNDEDLSEVGILLAQKMTNAKREEFVEAVVSTTHQVQDDVSEVATTVPSSSATVVSPNDQNCNS